MMILFGINLPISSPFCLCLCNAKEMEQFMRKKYSIFAILGILVVFSIMCCIHIRNKNNLDNWLGQYYYSETYPHNSGEIFYFIEYTITIYKEENKYYAKIVGDGWHTMTRCLAQVTGDQNKIEISYLQCLPDDLLYGCDSYYFHKGEVIWRFEREGSDLNTVWLAGKKFFVSFEEMDGEIITKSFEKVAQKESEAMINETEKPEASEVPYAPEHMEAETAGVQYEHWMDFAHEKNLPYASQQTFEAVRGFYSEIDFFGEFQKGDTEVYGEYKEVFLKLLQNEMPFRNRETGENVYLKDFERFEEKYAPQELEYYFFDMNEDRFPELVIRNDWDAYIFQYNAEANEFVLWYSMESGWYSLIGSRKVMWLGLGKYLAFYLLDQEGEEECVTFFLANWFNEEESLHVVMVPQYREAGRITVTEEMKAEGIYERYSGQWYFRVTEEQWYELADIYLEAEKTAGEKIKDVTYTYEELFGSLAEEDDVAAMCELVRAMDFTVEKPHMELTEAEDLAYKEAFLRLLKNELPIKGSEGWCEDGDRYQDLWWAGIPYENLLDERDSVGFPYFYYYDDIDGDGKPEFGVNQGLVYFFDYELGEEACSVSCGGQSSYFAKLLGVGKMLEYDCQHAWVERFRYVMLNSDGEWETVLDLQLYFAEDEEETIYTKYFLINGVDVGKENWEELTVLFFEAIECEIPKKTLTEVFGELLEEGR